MMTLKKAALFITNVYAELEQDFSNLKFRKSVALGRYLSYSDGAFVLNCKLDTENFESEDMSKVTLKRMCSKTQYWDMYDAWCRELPDYENLRKFGEAIKAVRDQSE